MNEWEIAAAVLGAAIIPCLGLCAFTTAVDALASDIVNPMVNACPLASV